MPISPHNADYVVNAKIKKRKVKNMKNKWLKKAMAAFLAVLMTVCAVPVAAFVPEMVETGEEFEQDLVEDSSEKNTSLSSDCWGNYGYTGYSTTINGVKVPLNEWPVGSYWTTDGKKRTSTSGNASLSLDGGWECYGFARYVYYKVFGVHENSSNDTEKVVGSMAASSITLTYLKNLFLDGTVVPGAHIRTKASGHSMIYMGADSTYIYTYECNSASAGSDGVYPCDVTVRRRNWTQMYNYLTIQKAGIDFISQPKNAGNVAAYDGYLYTQYNDPDGVHSINAQAAVGNEVGTIPTEDGSGRGYVVVTQYSSDGKWGYVNYKGIVGWTRLYEPYIKLVGAYTCPVVTFNANGGSVGTASKKVYINTPYGTLPTPTRTGYYFAGWYTAASGGSLVKEDTNVSITSNQTLYAQWTPYTYTVSYNANGGTGAPGNQTKTHGQSLTLSSVKPTKDGYTFQGWSTTLNGSVQYNPGSAYTGNANLTLYAVWSPKTYTISYNANGGTGAPASQTKVYGQNLTLSNVRPTKDGYTFQGWSTILYGTVAYQPGGQFGENRSMTLYAVWEANSVTSITLSQTTATLKKGETLTLTATIAPSDAANKSVTWSSSNTSVATVSTSGVVTAVGEGTAVITVKTADGGKTASCTVTVTTQKTKIFFNPTGGTGAPEPQFKIIGTDLILSETVPTKPNCEFLGWAIYDKINYQPGDTINFDWGTEEAYLYAIWRHKDAGDIVWTPESFNCDNWLPGNMQSYGVEDSVFVGEVSDASYIDPLFYNNFDRFYAENYRYVVVEAEISCDALDQNDCMAVYFSKGDTSDIDETTSIKYIHGGTTGGNYKTFVFDMAQNPNWNGMITILRIDPFEENTGMFKIKSVKLTNEVSYTVSYDANGGTGAPASQTKVHGDALTLSTVKPTRSGYEFKGWATSLNGNVEYSAGAAYTENADVTLYAVWAVNSVTSITLNKTSASLKKGETLSIAVTVSPSDAANKAFTVTSSNPSVMSAEYRIGVCVGDLFDGSACTASHYEFTALSAGSTTLTFTTEDGQKTASCTVTVTEPAVNAKAKFTLGETSGRPGDTVKITLSLKTEETVNSIAISGITYDKSIMTFTGFSDYEHIEDLTILPPTFDEEKMAIVIGLKNAAAFDGDICTLNFKINENALEGATNIGASSVVKLKSTEIPSAVTSGKVNIRLQKLGDIDGNDTVDIDDAVLLFQHSMLPELYPISYAGNLDFNKDGTVDIDDAVLLFQYSMLPDLYPLE